RVDVHSVAVADIKPDVIHFRQSGAGKIEPVPARRAIQHGHYAGPVLVREIVQLAGEGLEEIRRRADGRIKGWSCDPLREVIAWIVEGFLTKAHPRDSVLADAQGRDARIGIACSGISRMTVWIRSIDQSDGRVHAERDAVGANWLRHVKHEA